MKIHLDDVGVGHRMAVTTDVHSRGFGATARLA
jgi:hypothetical protein